jgi:glycosyltransferase involved in cell wall biosynthesis
MKKLLYLSQHFPPDAEAAAFRAYDMAQSLSARGFVVTVLTGFPNNQESRKESTYKFKIFIKEKIGNVTVIRLYTPIDNKRSAIKRLLNYFTYMFYSLIVGLLLSKHDIVYASTPPVFVPVSGLLISRLRRTKFVYEIRDLWIEGAVRQKILKEGFILNSVRKIDRYTQDSAAAIISVTKSFKEFLIDKGVKEDKIEIVYNGVNTLDNGYIERKSTEFPIDGLQNKFIVCYAGNIGSAQGLEIVIHAAKMLIDDKSVAFLIIGEGMEKERIITLKEKLRLNNIVFLNKKAREELLQFTEAAHCFLVPLLKHPLYKNYIPSKLFDCMAYGKPVLLGVDGESRTILEEADAGLYFDMDQPEQLVEKIRYLQNNPEESVLMGTNGKNFVKNYFTREIMADKLISILKDL